MAIPVRIVGYGYVAGDDVQRHTAKAVSGRNWSDILVLRPEVTMDSHPGWHAVLSAVHRLTGADPDQLAIGSVIGLFILVVVPPAFLLRRPEAWLVSILVLAVADPANLTRLVLGRPFLISQALLLVLCFGWARFAARRPWRPWHSAGLVVAFGIVAFMHPSWHLFLLPIAACLAAREIALAGRFLACLAGGVLLAGIFYGQPVTFVTQSLLHTWFAMRVPLPRAFELSPTDGSPAVALVVALVLVLRRARGQDAIPGDRAPVLWLAASGWMLGFVALRFWSDWGLPAALAFIALELQEWLEERAPSAAIPLPVTAALALAVFFSAASNVRSRWNPVPQPYAVLASPEFRAALPDPGGVLYTDDPILFYNVFHRLPKASFRYVVGYEAGLMPDDDLATYRQSNATRSPAAFAPWVRKMRPADRLVLRTRDEHPPIAELQWMQVPGSIWSGRVARRPGG